MNKKKKGNKRKNKEDNYEYNVSEFKKIEKKLYPNITQVVKKSLDDLSKVVNIEDTKSKFNKLQK